MIYITGDTHRDFSRFYSFKSKEDDMLIVLGDVRINYYLNEEDKNCKEYLKKLKLKLFCVRGNHEERPENISNYKEVEMFGGKVFIEEEYPNLIYAKDGETGKHFDIVLTHTCPYKYEPREVFMQGLDQSKVDKSMEHFLDEIEENISYDKWYCGHYHTEKQVDKLEFIFGRIKIFNKDEYVPKYDRNGYEIVRDAYSQNEVMKEEVKCPKCNSKNISVLKGDGFSIVGADYIAIICNDCKKVYGFNDVKYKTNCPKEL